MKDPLVRFGVAIEGSLLRQVDALTRERGCTRSELFRDLSRAEVGRAKVRKGVNAVCTLTIVYDHHVRDLGEKLTELQHEMGEGVRAALHVHLSHDLCLEVIVMRGPADELRSLADRILAMRGVKQGGLEIIADDETGAGDGDGRRRRAARPRNVVEVEDAAHAHAHVHAHSHAHSHAHAHAHAHAHEPPPATPRPRRRGRA